MISRFFASFVFASLLLACVGAPAASAASGVDRVPPIQRFERLIFRGDSALTKLPAPRAAPVPAGQDARLRRGLRATDIHPPVRRRPPTFAAAAIPVPSARGRTVIPAEADFFGFTGLTDVDQFSAGTGAYTDSQFESEPPDQGLCAGNGFVVEAVNNAVAVYSNLGTPLTAPTALNQLFRLPPQFSQSNLYGPFLANPKCYFDRDTQRWFLSTMEIDSDPYLGTLYLFKHSSIQLAVSHSGDPTAGYAVYAIDTTDASKSNCPCFGDQPLLGADANGLFVSINEFVSGSSGTTVGAGSLFKGAQIYALSKAELTKGTPPTIVHIDTSALPGANPWYSVQPAVAPDTSMAARTSNGTEYFVSALDFAGADDNRIAVWAMTNTQSLQNVRPDVGLQHVVISSEAYAQPPPAVQKVGPAPLANDLRLPLEALATDDDRMNQVVFAGGRLWSGLNTAVRVGSNVSAGVAFFAVVPAFERSGSLTAKIEQQGYIAVAGQNLMYPAIGVNSSGGAVMVATLSGPQYYPTAVYVTADGNVHIAGLGVGPDDGFSGYGVYIAGYVGYYRPYTGASWGAYSAAVADGDGSIWIASESIPGERTLWANWGTFIGHVQIHRSR